MRESRRVSSLIRTLPLVLAAIVAFGWAAQHIALPLGDPQWMLYRFLSSLPIALLMPVLYLRTRRLVPLIIAHAVADALATATLVLLPMLQR